jgi:RNA 2',3'-cyclic 3'-phosphodiesterase
MSETTRTFIAVPVPEVIAPRLVAVQKDLASELPGCRWVSAPPFHATLAFLGSVRNRDLKAVCDAVAASAGPFEPIELELRGIGTFPDSARPRVIWAGLSAPDLEPLFELRAAVVRALKHAGHKPDDQRFHPHITLGRFKSAPRRPGGIAASLARFEVWSGGAFSVAEAITFASTLRPTGPEYTPLAQARLEGQQHAGSKPG